jgi:hypothetical protein
VLQQKAHESAHVVCGTATQRSVSALITLFSFVSHITAPDHELPTHAMFSDHVIKCFEELHEHFDATINQNHFLSFSKLIWSWGRRSMAVAGEVTQHG